MAGKLPNEAFQPIAYAPAELVVMHKYIEARKMKKESQPKIEEKDLTLSNFVIRWLKDLDSRIKTSGFRKELFHLFNSEDLFDVEERKEMWKAGRCQFIPDAHLFDYDDRVVFIFEVEDTNTLSYQKMLTLSDAWWLLDEIYWDLRIFLIDRYCGNWRTLPLGDSQFIYMKTFHSKDSNSKEVSTVDWQQTYRNVAKHSWLFPLDECPKKIKETMNACLSAFRQLKSKGRRHQNR